MKSILTGLVLLLCSITIGFCQFSPCALDIHLFTAGNCENRIVTLTPFLNLPVNPHSAGIGGGGIASAPSSTSLTLNSSNLAFIDSRFGLQTTYTPWLRGLGLHDAYLLNSTGYGKIGDNNTIGASFRYFGLGEIEILFEDGDRHFEWEGLLSYNRKFSTNFSMGLSLKYIYSNLANGFTLNGLFVSPLNLPAGDVSFTYQKPLFKERNVTLITGLAIRNIGPKGAYLEGSDVLEYLPANLGIGIGVVREFSDLHTLTFTFDLNRLLVPTPSDELAGGDPTIPDYKERSSFQGMISSFGDAPSGLGEDFNENQYSLGIEYRYKFVIGRIGHFNEHRTKGGKKLITYGIGLRTKGVGIDFSYGNSLNRERSLEPWRISMSYDFAQIEKEEGTNIGVLY